MFGSNNKTLFGTSNTNSAFGQPTNSGFGVQSSATVQPFGTMTASQQPQQQSIFGPTAGQPLFGSTQTSIFGSNPNNANTNTFGAQPTSNAFSGSSSSIFGGNQQNNSLFGGNRFGTSSTPSPFGSTQLAQQITPPTGTTIKFNATAGTDTMMKNGVSQNISTRHQCITCMREYEMKSLEELRLEDYNANRKGPQQQNLFGSSSVSSGNLFSATSQPQNAFSSTSSTGLFGQNKPSFGSLAPTTTTSSGLFGNTFNKPLFGNTNSFPTVQNQTPTTSIFGAVSASNPTLNQPFFSTSSANTTATVKPLFGGTTAQPQQPLFGQTNTQNANLGQKPLFGNTSTSVPQFGTNTNTLFNTGNTSNLFSSSQPSLFNTGTNVANNTLAKPLFNFNNPTSMPINPTIGGTGVTSTPSLFGNTSNSFGNTSGSMFGSNPSNFNFGQTNTPFQTNSFMPNVGLQQMASNTSQPVSTDQLVTRFQTFPYGDSPQLQIDISISPNTKVRTKFTTDPKTLNQYKISAKTIENRPQRIANSSGKVKTMLFDGLEEDNLDETKTAKDIFVPRRNIKKLVFKPKSTSSMSNLNDSQLSSNNFLKTQERDGTKFDDSIASDMTVNEFISKDNQLTRRTQSTSKERLAVSPLEKGDISPLFTKSNTFQSGSEPNESVSSIIIPKCGVILTRTDYYTIPTIEELDSAYDMSSDTCIVDSFTVGRHDYGSIYWDGPIDVKGINLDEVVHIRRKEVTVYPDEEVAPRVGEGLNRAAQITLHQVWPIDKTTHEIIKDIDRLRAMKYAEKIETATHKLRASFKEYRPDTGSWVFTVKHFSKYGLTEEDDEEEELVIQTANETDNQTLPKQTQLTKDMAINKKMLLTKDAEQISFSQPSDLNVSNDELSAKLIQPKDNTMNFLLDDNLDEHIDGFDVDKSFDYSSQLQTKFSEYDKMRSTLFDDYEEVVVAKKSKNYPIITSQKDMKSKIYSKDNYFSPNIAVVKPVMPKRRLLTFEPDVYAADNKIICDISSVCVSRSPRISFFNGSRKFTYIKGGTVLVCELNLIDLDNNANERFTQQLENNSNLIVSPTNNPIIAPFIETRDFSRNSQNPLELELLVEALYGNLSEVTPYACHQERIDRIQVWLFSVNKKLSLPKKTMAKIVHFLSTNELEAAVDEAIQTNNPRLASLLSCGSTVNKDLLIAQLDSWKRSKADLFIDKELLKIYILMSGQTNWQISSGVNINILKDLNWTQQLALILLYKTPSDVQNHELGVNLLLTSIAEMTVLPDEVEYHLLAAHTPWVAMSSSSNLLDSWFLHQSLKCYHVIIDDNQWSAVSDAVHCFVASQITDIRWSCFVASHIKHDFIREIVIKDIIARNCLDLSQKEGIESWILQNISLPKDYVAEAKAIRAKVSFDYKNVAINLIDCQQWTEAHDVLVEHVFPEMIINEEYDSITELISKLRPHSHLISNWFSSGANIYETFLNCLHSSNIEDIKLFNVHQLKCNTKRHVLCQSEMARKANIIYSELSGGIFAYNTPIPDDYALLELKMNAKRLVKLLIN